MSQVGFKPGSFDMIANWICNALDCSATTAGSQIPLKSFILLQDKFRAERRHKHKIKTIILKNPKFRTEKNLKKIKASPSDEYEDYESGNITDEFLFDYGKLKLYIVSQI